MKTKLQTIKRLIAQGIAILVCMYSLPAIGQQSYTSSTTATVIKGTSTLHDWDMKSSNGNIQASFKIENGEITGINALTFTVNAETLKSSKSGLDKNAYKALNTGKHKSIVYKMTSGTVTKSGTSYTIKTNGMLNIAGTSKALSLTTTATLNSDQSISVKGSTKFDMSSYGVTPPTVMMGTIKTGDAITIEYNGKLTK
jgi:hypothetical protein